MHPLLITLFCLSVAPLPKALLGNDPNTIDNRGKLFETEGELDSIPYEGDSSFTDDVDLDVPQVPPPGFAEPKPPETPPSSLPEELVIDLKNPVFSQGIISTQEGGVISGTGDPHPSQKNPIHQ